MPEVSGDESALVPPQSGPKAEWPKKIRTLTASELDRLTIDAEGRFMWDGRVVNYDGPKVTETKAPEMQNSEPKTAEPNPGEIQVVETSAAKPTGPVDPFDQIAAEIMASTNFELSDRKPAEPARVVEPVMPAETVQLADEIKRVEETKKIEEPKIKEPELIEATEPAAESKSVDQFTPVVPVAPVVADLRAVDAMRTVPVALRPERVRVKLSAWQSLGLIIVILGFLLGAAGVAALGFVAANDWSCRVGLTAKYCPLPPPAPPAPPPRAEIPA
jgi:hypothetical protein